MSNNPIIHNTGGINRFQDYVAQIPDFLREEDDVVTLLQFFSDYINNAYRNITTVEKFEFSLITSDSRLIYTKNKLQQLVDLFKASFSRSIPVNYLSLPKNKIIQFINYGGSFDSLDTNAVTVPFVDENVVYVKFSDSAYSEYDGEYVISGSTLTLSTYSTSQDPFNNTPNEPYVDFFGISSRMLQFNVSDIGDVKIRKIGTYNDIVYYTVFFDASLTNMVNIPSVYNIDDKYVVDYYNQLQSIPTSFDTKYSITFAPSTDTLTMGSYPKGIFYARELTKYSNNDIWTTSKPDTNLTDPVYSESTSVKNITSIAGDGVRVLVCTKEPHRLSVGDTVTILDNGGFDGIFTVVNILDSFNFEYVSSVVSGGLSGLVVVKNLFATKVYDNSINQLYVPYINKQGDSEFAVGDMIARISEVDPLYYQSYLGTSLNITSNFIEFQTTETEFIIGDLVVVRYLLSENTANPDDTGIVLGTTYTISNIYKGTTIRIYLSDATITGTSVGTFRLYKVKQTAYFDSYSGVSNSLITLPESIINNLEAGYCVKFTGSMNDISGTSLVELPSPLIENIVYQINTIDYISHTISLIDESGLISLVNAPIGKRGCIQLARVDYSRNDIGIVSHVRVYQPKLTGRLTLSKFSGDLISIGEFAKVNDGKIVNISTINTTLAIWNVNTTYSKNDLVAYLGTRYKAIKGVNGSVDATVPSKNNSFVSYMSELVERKKSIISNPYMFGIYDMVSMEQDDSYDITKGNTELSRTMNIKKKQNIALDIGTDQREWIFDPRFAPEDNLKRNGYLELFLDDSLNSLPEGTILYCKQNLFDVSDINPMVPTGDIKTVTSLTIATGTDSIATVTTTNFHMLDVDDVIELVGTGISSLDNLKISIYQTLGSNIFTVILPFGTYPASITGNISIVRDVYYKYTIKQIQWQKKGIHNPKDYTTSDVNTKITIPANNKRDNVAQLSDTYTFTKANGSKVKFTDGDIVILQDQLVSYENNTNIDTDHNGYYKVVEGTRWRKLDKKLAMKIREITIDSYENLNNDPMNDIQVPYVYRTYVKPSPSEINAGDVWISNTHVGNYQFLYETIENIDTTKSYEQVYDARRDKNSIAPRDNMKSTFTGIPDMGYPLIEKIERLKYLKDPNVIDLELISYLSKFMGYDITLLADDISENAWYNSDEDVEKAIRRAVQQLPQFYTLKANESGLELLMKVFGIIGELVTLWTRNENAYDTFIEDYRLRANEYQDMESGVNSNWVPTPHFKITTKVEGNYSNTLLPGDFKRLNLAIQQYKPINTVFRGVIMQLDATLKAKVGISRMAAKGRMKCAIGYDSLIWNSTANDCF